MEPEWDGGTKIDTNDLGHMTKMAAMPICSKNPSKILFSKASKPMTFQLGIQYQWLGPYKVCSNDETGFTLTYFTATLLPNACVWENA